MSKKKDWVYYGIFFSEEMKRNILAYTEKLMDKFTCPSDHRFKFNEDWKIYCDHVTITYNDCTEVSQLIANYYKNRIGEKVILSVIGIGISDKAVALEVDYKTKNEHSHITVATAPDVNPYESNNIKNWYKVRLFAIEGTIGKYPKNN